MNKIMFNDRYGLTEAVLNGTKTMTRRLIRNLLDFDPLQDWIVWGVNDAGKANIGIIHIETYKYSIYPKYQPDEDVAVARSYKDLGYTMEWVEQHIRPNPNAKQTDPFEKKYPGWNNKMFMPSELNNAPKIRITDIKMERLQDISDEDCLKEGIFRDDIDQKFPFVFDVYGKRIARWRFQSPKEAFAALINMVSGKGTWESNHYVFAYSFFLK